MAGFDQEVRKRLRKAERESHYGNCATAYRELVNAGYFAGSGEGSPPKIKLEIKAALRDVNRKCLRRK